MLNYIKKKYFDKYFFFAYKYFKFYKNGHEVRTKYAVHKIVDVCFNNGKLDKDTHHIDFNKLNNHYTNLVSLNHKDHLRYHKKGVNGKYLLKYYLYNMHHFGIQLCIP